MTLLFRLLLMAVLLRNAVDILDYLPETGAIRVSNPFGGGADHVVVACAAASSDARRAH